LVENIQKSKSFLFAIFSPFYNPPAGVAGRLMLWHHLTCLKAAARHKKIKISSKII
jgi:hypothetical protein